MFFKSIPLGLLVRCPSRKGAIIWYDHCLLKYSDVSFFGQIDTNNRFYLYNVQEVENGTVFNKKVKELLSEVPLDTFTTLYGLAQCTRDLSGVDCKKCLDSAIGELPNCCNAKRGGRAVGGSCNVRFELYPIVST
ncbi:cysteine-rich repeat secretory protein 38-like [Pyrus ussuriensis x Pyrus communis]|uniref:Cysteine-rich repeat secretory protein 38-like n=1 Tax=Pyrus ussuriensis x Pyrus communis TaxID=2448454 RepID=A0A5N5FJA6_9ROSA|nr:cysteine-rich repeat secretory protein 38-like [Pyrus ussuriensis x Pyrus communis]